MFGFVRRRLNRARQRNRGITRPGDEEASNPSSDEPGHEDAHQRSQKKSLRDGTRRTQQQQQQQNEEFSNGVVEDENWPCAHNGGHVNGDGEIGGVREATSSLSFTERIFSSSQATSRTESAAASHFEKDQAAKIHISSSFMSTGDALPFLLVFKLLLVPRVLSALVNIIHDCDETFNYWEPLHYMLNGEGLQTWEYSSQYGLRTWLYIALHAVPATLLLKPLQPVFPGILTSVAVFYVVRVALAVSSAAADALLVVAISGMTERRVALFLLVFLMSASALFTQSTAFLPSSFSMVMITLAIVSVLHKTALGVVANAGVSCVVGWPFTALACAPFGISAVLDSSIADVVLKCLVCFLLTLMPMVAIDRVMYGRWIFPQFNLLHYNVFGSGDSTLYGVEPWSFYLRNLLNGFNAVLPLALISLPFVWLVVRDIGDRIRLLVVLAPLYVWLTFMTLASDHKEERFMTPVYTVICLGGAVATAGICRASELFIKLIRMGKRGLTLCSIGCWLCVVLITLVSVSRTAAIITNYGAPMHIYRFLPATERPQLVCLGDEWHRFPSSFHLPQHYSVGFIKTESNQSMLPVYFDARLGGSAGSPAALNDRNEAHPDTYVSESTCDYRVELLRGEADKTPGGYDVVQSLPYLDAERSPALTRAFFVPRVSSWWNKYGRYVLLKKRRRRRSKW